MQREIASKVSLRAVRVITAGPGRRHPGWVLVLVSMIVLMMLSLTAVEARAPVILRFVLVAVRDFSPIILAVVLISLEAVALVTPIIVVVPSMASTASISIAISCHNGCSLPKRLAH